MKVVSRSVLVLLLVGLVLPLAAGSHPAAARSTTLASHPRIYLTPTLLSALRARAQAGATAWVALKSQCDTYLTGHVEWPDGVDYPDGGSIGEGYQGSEYYAAVANLGLCYEVVRTSNPAKASAYAAKGVDVLTKMSAPYGAGQHGENPLRDDGYGVRFYGSGMALGFDWLFPALSSSLKTRLDTSLNAWLTAFGNGGFERDFPQGNYFAGYYAAKALAGLALDGDTPHAATWLSAWLNNLQNGMVQPYYAGNLSGGGWPEGWNYGPFGSLNMSWPALAVKTALGTDLVHAAKPYAYPLANPRYVLYFTWPNQKTLEDSGLVYDGDNPTAVRPSYFGDEAGLLEAWGDPFAPYFHSFAQQVRVAQPLEDDEADAHLWDTFLFWNPAAATKSYTTLPLSYLAKGMDMGAVRSSWNTGAVWGALMGGPYSEFQDAGEELPDKGSLAIVRGGRQLLVNAYAALLRNTPGTGDGRNYTDFVYDDVFGSPPSGNRDIFNVFYTNPKPLGQGSRLRSSGSRTAMTRFEDGGTYVAMRSLHLEDNYPQYPDSETKSVTSWTRDVVYLRPEIFVVYDRTSVAAPSIQQWMSFHLAQRTSTGTPPASGIDRWDVGTGPGYAGSVETVLPAGHVDAIAGLFGTHKIDRLTIKPATASASNRWLTVFDAAATPAAATRALQLTVKLGAVLGVVCRTSTQNYAVVAGSGAAGTAVAGEVKYVVPAFLTRHVVTDLLPSTAYAVHATVSGSTLVIDLKAGAGITTSATGVLSFATSAAGLVSG